MRRALPLFAVTGLAAAAMAWQTSVDQLQQDGKTISTHLRVVDGTLMVPVKDVASYLGGDLTVQNGTATIGASRKNDPIAGAAYGVTNGGLLGTAGTTGMNALNPLDSQSNSLQPLLASNPKRPDPKDLHVNVGQDANNDGFVLRVLGVEEITKGKYKTQFDPRNRDVSPSLKNDKIVVVRMRIENRTSETRRPTVPAGLDLSLFDAAGIGTPVQAFDARPIGYATDFDSDLGQYDTLDAPLLEPKGSFEFAAVFSQPKDAVPTKLAIALPPANENAGGANVIVVLK